MTAGETPNASEQRADGWQRDTADQRRTVATLARDLRAEQQLSARLARELVETRAEVERLRSVADEARTRILAALGIQAAWPWADLAAEVERQLAVDAGEKERLRQELRDAKRGAGMRDVLLPGSSWRDPAQADWEGSRDG